MHIPHDEGRFMSMTANTKARGAMLTVGEGDKERCILNVNKSPVQI